ncbi:MAG: hypothetical protein EHM15_03465 [Desulfobacteraceae bacterium]|nr:MAG: hypothetical protein EHM15_03465 [Desulfobacteraceae bacterium]
MTNREKIILGAAVLALGVGAIELLLPRAKTDPFQQPQNTENVTAFIAKMADATQNLGTETATLLIRKAESDWKQDPFADIPRPSAPVAEEKQKKTDRPPPNLAYSGYIEAGDKRLAIINGQEYATGDTLEPGGFTIKSILPTRVTLVPARGGAAPIVLPLQESE